MKDRFILGIVVAEIVIALSVSTAHGQPARNHGPTVISVTPHGKSHSGPALLGPPLLGDPIPQQVCAVGTLKSETATQPTAMIGSSSESYSLDDLEKLALANNPTIPAALASVQQRQGSVQQVGLYPNPTVGYVRTDADQTGQGRTQGVFVSQDFVTAGKRRIAQAAASGEVEFASWNLEAQQIRVLNDVRIRFYDVLGAQQAVEGARELTGLATEALNLAKQLLKAKQGSRLDILQAELQLSAVQTSLQDAQYRYQSAWRQLAAVVGLPQLQPAVLHGQLETAIPRLDWNTSLDKLLSNSPLLHAQQAEIRASENDLKLARAQAIPNINIQMVAERDYIQNYSSVSTLVSLPIPFFNRNQGNIYSSRARLDQQVREYERIRLTLVDQLSASFRQYLTVRNQAERLKKEIVPRAKENLDLTIQGYKLQQFDLFRVVTAQQFYFQTRLAYIDALTDLHKTAVEIEGLQLTGGLNPTEAGTALQGVSGRSTGARGVLLQQLQEQRSGSKSNLPGALQSR